MKTVGFRRALNPLPNQPALLFSHGHYPGGDGVDELGPAACPSHHGFLCRV